MTDRTNSFANTFGGLPEWSKGADCKSAGVSLQWFKSTTLHQPARTRTRQTGDERARAGVAQLVERQPSKLNVAGSSPVSRSPQELEYERSTDHAQTKHSCPGSSVVEHLLGKEEVVSSILILGSAHCELT